MERLYEWPDGRRLELGKKTAIMGILNITPDSFFDGGKWQQADKALAHAKEMVAAGADIIDIGAESTRPGAEPLTAAEEIERLLPPLNMLLQELPVPISVDTYKAATAEAAAKAGANVINDVWGFQYAEEPGEMAKVAARYKLPVILMHNQVGTAYPEGLTAGIRDFFRRSVQIALSAGVARENIILDTGLGFGKNAAQNMAVLRNLATFKELDGQEYPQLLGASRKSFIGAALGLATDERLEGTGAVCVWGVTQGISVVRVHDVAAIGRMCRMIDAIIRS